jgi:hypothetical protein
MSTAKKTSHEDRQRNERVGVLVIACSAALWGFFLYS